MARPSVLLPPIFSLLPPFLSLFFLPQIFLSTYYVSFTFPGKEAHTVNEADTVSAFVEITVQSQSSHGKDNEPVHLQSKEL